MVGIKKFIANLEIFVIKIKKSTLKFLWLAAICWWLCKNVFVDHDCCVNFAVVAYIFVVRWITM